MQLSSTKKGNFLLNTVRECRQFSELRKFLCCVCVLVDLLFYLILLIQILEVPLHKNIKCINLWIEYQMTSNLFRAHVEHV